MDNASDRFDRPGRDSDLDEPRFLIGDVVMATGLSVNVLKAWLSREPKVIQLGPYDRESLGRGSARVFTLRRVISIAVTAELVSLGLAPSRAGELAYSLTDEQADAAFFVESLIVETAVVAYPGQEKLEILREDSRITEVFSKSPSQSLNDAPASCVIVSFSAVAKRVRTKLGL